VCGNNGLKYGFVDLIAWISVSRGPARPRFAVNQIYSLML